MTHIIAVSNQKGGVGKTTTSVNLAACLGAAGYPTLLVDMDPQGNATSSVGVDHRRLSTTLYRTLVGLDTPDPVVLHPNLRNLYLLPSSMDLAAAEFEFHQLDNRETRLRTVLEEIRSQFAYIIIDSPPSLNLLSINTLCASQHVLVPVQAEFMALEGLAHVLNTIERIRSSYNPDLDILGLAVTLYDGRTRLAGEVVQELETKFNSRVFKTKIVRSVRLSEAPSHGKPIIYYDPRSAGALAYTQLAEEIIHVCEKASPGTWPGRSIFLAHNPDESHAAGGITSPAGVPERDSAESASAADRI